MDNVMQGYDLDAAVRQIGKAIGKAAKAAPDAAEAFARRAIEADMRYMHETGVLDDDGLMGEGEYDEDDAFEALFAEMTDGLEDDGESGGAPQCMQGAATRSRLPTPIPRRIERRDPCALLRRTPL